MTNLLLGLKIKDCSGILDCINSHIKKILCQYKVFMTSLQEVQERNQVMDHGGHQQEVKRKVSLHIGVIVHLKFKFYCSRFLLELSIFDCLFATSLERKIFFQKNQSCIPGKLFIDKLLGNVLVMS